MVKLIEDHIGENLKDPGYDYDFLDTTQKVWFMTDITNKLGFFKI